MRRLFLLMFCSCLVVSALQPLFGQSESDTLHKPYDTLLDLYVRDGLVYYNALRSDRRRLDAYIDSLNGPRAQGVSGWPREEQIAFWLNAYNALVLRTVVDRYPIRGTASNYPSSSIRQIPGAFDKVAHRVAGRSLTLDQIENTIIGEFRDPRLFVALGRGALGSGRLRSEAYAGTRLGAQLAAVAAEFATGGNLLDIGETTGVVAVSPILSWREKEFVAAYADATPPRFARRSPIERAVVAFAWPNLLTHEREFLERNEFTVQYQPFDWRLNDLTGGRR